jgi:UDP-glucose 4-epimerase
MKRVLITGKNSYVGTNVEKWLMKEPDKFYVETISLRDPSWKDFDFSKFDVVLHVAGIAHVSQKKSMENLYYKVNKDLALETAIKSKNSGIKQFIFMSSIIVYSSKDTKITKDTEPCPDNFYGQSKLEAEKTIYKMNGESFKVSVIRAPMIYGPGSKGNFKKLISLTDNIFLFPMINNVKSILFIDNLSELIKLIILNKNAEVFCPQNSEYVSTSEIVKVISEIKNKKILITKSINFIVLILFKFKTINKLFNSYYYEKEMSFIFNGNYRVVNFIDSIKITLNESR